MDCEENSDAPDSAAKLAQQLTSHCSRLQLFLVQWSHQQEIIIESALEARDPGKSALDTEHVSVSFDDRPVAEAQQSEIIITDNPLAMSSPSGLQSDIIPMGQTSITMQKTWLEDDEEEARPPEKMCSSLRKIIEGDMEHYHQLKNNVEHQFKEKKQKKWLPWFVSSHLFDTASNLVIIVNALVMAVGIDYAMNHPRDPRTSFLDSLEVAFTVYYTTELILKIIAEGAYFIFSDDAKWNLFDAVLVLSALYEVVSNSVQPQGAGGNISFMRVIKLAKMVKTLRVLRVLKSFRGLRLIVSSMGNSMTTILWSSLLILIIAFTVSVMFTQTIANYISENAGDVSSDMLADTQKYWRTVLTGMVSLYMASTGGENWSLVAEPLKPCGAVFYMLFMLYIMFFLFVIVNTLASIFIEATFTNAGKDDKAMIQQEMKKKNEHIRLIRRLFYQMDVQNSGKIEKQLFMEKLNEPQMLAFFSRIGIDAVDAADFLDVLMLEDGHALDVDEFVLGCMKLKGPARSMDLLGFIHAHDANARLLHNTLAELSSALKTLRAEINVVDKINARSSEVLCIASATLSQQSHVLEKEIAI